jgi:nicotinate-nucleotide pyrophosphorylase (carboxylating)
VRAALLEDLGRAGDITTDAIVGIERTAQATFAARESGIVAGIEAAVVAFQLLDENIRVDIAAASGTRVEAGQTIARIAGSARAILSAERTALNLVGHLSGIASLTAQFVEAVRATKCHIVCTRKTMPGLRGLEKFAVRAGGGFNHRFGLDDAVLIKDNHIAVAGGIRNAVTRVRTQIGHLVKVELEVDTFEQLREAVELQVDLILLDNMTTRELEEAVAFVNGRAILEASGSMRLERVAEVAAAGVDLLSVGALTHSSHTLDIGLDIEV